MKRKLFAGLLALCLALGLLPSAVLAASPVVALKLNSPWCAVDTQVVMVDEDNAQVAPYAVQTAGGGHTLLPIRRVLETFGGHVDWVPATGGVLCTLNGRQVELTPGSADAKVDGKAVTMEVPAEARNDRTFVPVRFVSENLGLYVEYEGTSQIVVVSGAPLNKSGLTALEPVKLLAAKTAVPAGEPTSLTSGSYTLASGKVSANVVTVNMSDPRVSVKTAIVGNQLNATASFSEIVSVSGGAAAVINANFFESYETIKDPIGPVMVDGTVIYGNSGAISSLGITSDNRMYYGRPSIFYRVKTTDAGTGQEWSGYNCNVFEQDADGSVLYTPARGASVPVACDGAVLTVSKGVTTGYQPVKAGDTISVPADGYALWMGSGFTATHYYQVPELGRAVSLEPYLRVTDEEGFVLDGVTSMLSGAPRLVRDGAQVDDLEDGFTEARFTTNVSPRTAVGTTADGKLLLVNSPAASVQQMRELMLQLGCQDAINLDGGASTAMYYNGKTICAPGRQLTVTLQVFVSP